MLRLHVNTDIDAVNSSMCMSCLMSREDTPARPRPLCLATL